MTWLLELLLDVLQATVFALLVLFAAVSCNIFINLVIRIVGGYFGIS